MSLKELMQSGLFFGLIINPPSGLKGDAMINVILIDNKDERLNFYPDDITKIEIIRGVMALWSGDKIKYSVDTIKETKIVIKC